MENKPAGMCKHFRMAVVLDGINAAVGAGEAHVTAAQVWAFLETMYNMKEVEEIEAAYERWLTGESVFREGSATAEPHFILAQYECSVSIDESTGRKSITQDYG